MNIGELFKDREARLYPSPPEIVAQELESAHLAYAQHGVKYDDMTLLAFQSRTLRKNVGERAAERDRYSNALGVANEALSAAGLPTISAWPVIAKAVA